MLAHTPITTARPVHRTVRAWIASVIARLDAHIDSRPMPSRRRLGAWETFGRPVCEQASQEA